MPHISTFRGNTLINDFAFEDRDFITVGRSQTNDIVLADPQRRVSRQHAVIVRSSGNRYFIRDLGSRYALTVGGVICECAWLTENSSVEISQFRLLFEEKEKPKRGSLLRVVPRRPEALFTDGSTIDLTQISFAEAPGKSQLHREFLDQLRKIEVQELSSLASPMVRGLCSITEAEKGFIQLYAAGEQNVEANLGEFGITPEQPIDISEPRFLSILESGQIVNEGHVVLAPLVGSENTIGFFCLAKNRRREPFGAEEIEFLGSVGRFLGKRFPMRGSESKRAQPFGSFAWPSVMAGASRAMEKLRDEIRQAAATSQNVLILGSTGTGKELVARSIHHVSRRKGEFIAQNVGAVPETLAESAIFGYAPRSGIAGSDPKGAMGWFELAHGGTLFLDEIHRLSRPMQDKFLRVLQDHEIWRFGALNGAKVDVKVIAATDHDLASAVENGEMGRAFYFRFGQIVKVPPLCERTEDIPLLAHYFLDSKSTNETDQPRSLSHRAVECLLKYDWPGNVRELEQCIQTAAAKAGEIIFSWDLPEHIAKAVEKLDDAAVSTRRGVASAAPVSLDAVERRHIVEVLESTRGNKTRAAEALGVSRMTLLNKMDKFQIPREYGNPAGANASAASLH